MATKLDAHKRTCLIHMNKSKDDDDHLVSPVNYESWLTLLEAANIRNHDPLLKISEKLVKDEIPEIYYHRKCRSTFTMKRDLENIKRKAENLIDDGSSGSEVKRSCRRSMDAAMRVYEPVCIFCDKIKWIKNTRTREKLVQAVQLRADKTLRECAVQKGDDKILAVTSRDIVAAEAHYHVSCYKVYTKVNKEEYELKESEKVPDVYQIKEKEAYDELFEYIRNEIIDSKQIVAVVQLTKKLESIMLSSGVQSIQDHTKKHIRRKLEAEFGESVTIFQDNGGKLLFVPEKSIFKRCCS